MVVVEAVKVHFLVGGALVDLHLEVVVEAACEARFSAMELPYDDAWEKVPDLHSAKVL